MTEELLVVYEGGMCKERSDELKGFYRHYACASLQPSLPPSFLPSYECFNF